MNDIPTHFSLRIIELYGEKGVEWLNGLPTLIAQCEQRWSLRVSPPFDLSYNYVAPAARADGTEVVLKIGVPNPELLTEMEALRLYDGRGIVQLLDADPDQGILLIERLKPGVPLSSLDDDEQATVIAAQVMRQLWRPVPPNHKFPSVAKWALGLKRLRAHYDGGTGPFPAHLVEAAGRLFDELIGSITETVLLHGDLHHENILSAERQPWLAIDPKGVVGDPAYEVSVLLYNHLPEPLEMLQLERLMARRVDLLAEALGFDRERLLGWGVAQAVLSAWWGVEDHGQVWDEALACAEVMAGLMD